MTKKDLVEVVTSILYHHDPAGTYCNLNEIYDEYRQEAEMITNLFYNKNHTVRHALLVTFDHYFKNCYDIEKLGEAYREINAELL